MSGIDPREIEKRMKEQRKILDNQHNRPAAAPTAPGSPLAPIGDSELKGLLSGIRSTTSAQADANIASLGQGGVGDFANPLARSFIAGQRTSAGNRARRAEDETRRAVRMENNANYLAKQGETRAQGTYGLGQRTGELNLQALMAQITGLNNQNTANAPGGINELLKKMQTAQPWASTTNQAQNILAILFPEIYGSGGGQRNGSLLGGYR